MSLNQIHNFDYTVLFCERMAETRAFYQHVMGFPVEVPRNWFARTTEELVEIDTRAIEDEQRVIDVYAEAGLLRSRVEAAAAFDDGFNAAVRRGRGSAS